MVGNKLKMVLIIMLIATIYSTLLVSASFNFGNNFKQSESVEFIEKKEEIPRLYIEGELSNMTKLEGTRNFKVKYKSNYNNFEKYATLKVQGSSSVAYEKKNYTIKFYTDKNCTEKFKTDLGWGREYKYVIKANWIDKTHSRNIVTAKIASKIQKKYNLFENTPNYGVIDGFPIEVYLNNEFYGLYTLNIPKDEWLYNMDDKNDNHIVMIGDQHLPTTEFRKKANFTNWQCEVGVANDQTLEKFNRLVDFIKNSTDEEFKQSLDQYVNIDAAINYYIIIQVFYLSDNYGKNLVMATYDGKIWYPTLYDLDTSFGTLFNGRDEFPADSIVNIENNLLFEKLNRNFSNEIAKRYFELRQDILSEQSIVYEIDKFYNSIPRSLFQRETEKWGTDIPGYDISQMKTFIKNRLPVIDELMRKKYTKNQLRIDDQTNKSIPQKRHN